MSCDQFETPLQAADRVATTSARSDQKSDKATYPKLFGLEESRRRAHKEVKTAVESLSSFGESAEPLRAKFPVAVRGARRRLLTN